MKKISTITFHASYNFGSCLQAYALQEYIKKLCNNDCEYKIINFRTNKQKDIYKNCFEKNDAKNYLKRLISLKSKNEIYEKDKKFEDFINKKLNVTKEYSSLEELKKENWDSDYFISGSDQIWNVECRDFDWAYFLEFTNKGKKISYAASMGPKQINWSEEEKNRLKNDLDKYDYVSVRDNNGLEFVNNLMGKKPEINVDPTMLLEKEEWKKIIPKEPLVNGDYIFFYNLKGKEYIELANKIAKKMNLPIVVSLYNAKDLWYSNKYGFIKKIDTGPIEFLNLINNAKLILSSSFHGTIFSIILNKPFFALNGSKDFRINTILRKIKLEDRSIDIDDFETKSRKAYELDYDESKKLLEIERNKSGKYLRKALDIKSSK